ncbi:MAG TPA: class I SAM-dependent methyltransferase [Candidatus Acidoferrales bacterium]|nr:class I SAM-dependent methyltransferase [Candidatus Acidoferrales bacterium]
MKAPRCLKIYDAVVRRAGALGLPVGAKVLDAPCGDGEIAIMLARSGFEVSGVDIVNELTPEAREALGGRFQIGDLTSKLPWPDASFDLVVSIEGIEHLENAFVFAREVNRVCRPGGFFIVTTPNTISIRSRVRFFGSGFYLSDPRPLNEASPHTLHHVGLKTFSELRYILQISGFDIFDVQPTHVKPISYAYGFLAPWMWLYTLIAFRKERDAGQRARNKEIRRAQSSRAILFGENILVAARKIE